MSTTAAASSRKSTTVRATKVPWRLRAAFRTLDVVAPGPAARWALELWCTIPVGSASRMDTRPHLGAISRLSRAEGDVVVETWGRADGAPVYLVHGWGGWRGQLGAFVDPLVAAGFRVVAFDAPSHGESAPGAFGPRRSTAVEMAAAFTDVAREHGAPDAVVAHSLGTATTTLAVSDGLPARRLVLVAPAVDPMNEVAEFQRALGFGPRTRRRLDPRLERRAGRPLTDISIAAATSRLPTTLLVHDRGDRRLAFESTARLAAGWPSAQLEATEGLGHQRILADDAVVGRVVEFVRS
ncbi:conserved hypothetical protein [Beutenbergia cavernae DSM 12333]|uniref:Serine aminopeptidase S33 domain-containing protein n=1 Tax=Beutenbergia cavernae (strain ATCC BAA-8 / DSM 12333 / CCUG 43141 / JCM 11478 / NBRC 16432 / NCIMB 13614 / HKI 0122) TaxID=471853 RepID=C5BWZ5_BEUC1|nr:alpha/beta fold hydrolase [Beutenbergia cavernae]ACQ80811.1 conserved hypothetical protein [Beutenbergia cavernae DSM 12333]